MGQWQHTCEWTSGTHCSIPRKSSSGRSVPAEYNPFVLRLGHGRVNIAVGYIPLGNEVVTDKALCFWVTLYWHFYTQLMTIANKCFLRLSGKLGKVHLHEDGERGTRCTALQLMSVRKREKDRSKSIRKQRPRTRLGSHSLVHRAFPEPNTYQPFCIIWKIKMAHRKFTARYRAKCAQQLHCSILWTPKKSCTHYSPHTDRAQRTEH